MALFPQLLLDLHDELVVDLFAGGGGASTGIEAALGRQVDVAVNHSPQAVAMHRANHPQTAHHQSDVFEVCPRDVTGGRPVGLMWMSPDCTFHSKARGSKPIRDREKRRRALAWVGLRWAGQARPRVIMLENVEEFAHWCPLVAKRDRKTGRVLRTVTYTDEKGKERTRTEVAAPSERVPVEQQELVPDKRRKGETFRKWVRALEALGYAVEWRELRACDYGAPTIRRRLFVVARCDGRPIAWPSPSHGDPKSEDVKRGRLKPYRTAAECIDWSKPICSIFATREEAKAFKYAHGLPGTPVRPLAENTEKRIARGVVRYIVEAGEPFIVPIQNWGWGDRNASLDNPLRTVTGHPKGGGFALVAPTLAQTGYGERDGQAPRSLDIEAPLGTVVGSQKHALVAAHLSTYYGEKREGDARGAELGEPLRTQTTENRHALVTAHLHASAECDTHRLNAAGRQVSYVQRDFGQSVGHGAEEPMGTITGGSNGHAAIVSAFLAQNNAGFYNGDGRDLREPNGTALASGSHQSLVAASLAKLRGTSPGHTDAEPPDVRDPLHTIGTGGNHAIVAAHLTHNYTSNTNGGEGDLGLPIKTITGGQHAGLVAAFLAKYYGTAVGQDLSEPVHTIPTVDRFGLVTVEIGGQPFVITDIGMRMLQPRELYRANGFPRSYVIDYGIGEDGERVEFTKTQQVLMCGNAVPPEFAEALAAANVPELAVRRTEKVAA